MKRCDFYRVYKGNKNDPKNHRVFMVVSRQLLIDSQFSTVICAPVHSKYDGLPTQVEVGVEVNMIFGEYDREMDIAVNRREAREEGEEIGMNKEKLIIAKNLLSEGSTFEFVHRITGLSTETIAQL